MPRPPRDGLKPAASFRGEGGGRRRFLYLRIEKAMPADACTFLSWAKGRGALAERAGVLGAARWLLVQVSDVATSGREPGHGPADAELFPETGPMLARDWQGPKQKPIPGQAQARADCPLAAETCAPHGMLPDPVPRRPGLSPAEAKKLY